MRISDWSSDVCSSDLFDDRGCDAAIRNVSETLRCEHHGYILLAQHLQPFADACGEQRVVEEHPGFVENEQRRPPGEPLFETMKKIGEDRRDDAGLSHQRLRLKTLHVGNGEVVLGGIKQATERTLPRSEENTTELPYPMR